MSNKIIYNGQEYNGSIVNDTGVGEFYPEGSQKNRTGDNNEIFNSYHSASGNIAEGRNCHAEGQSTKAYGYEAHAEGSGTQAGTKTGEGINVSYSGYYAHAEGNNTLSSGIASHAEGQESQATGGKSHAEGYNTLASGENSHAEGGSTQATNLYAHSEGEETVASHIAAHAEGSYTVASATYSHAEGNHTAATANATHAEGEHSEATSQSAHAEGWYTTASGAASHSTGHNTLASGQDAYAGGESTTASGIHSVAIGLGTIADQANQMVMGKYNATDLNAAFIIGNGTMTETNNWTWNGHVFTGIQEGVTYETGAYIYFNYSNNSTWRSQGLNLIYIWSAKQTITQRITPFQDWNNNGKTISSMLYWEPIEGTPTRVIERQGINILTADWNGYIDVTGGYKVNGIALPTTSTPNAVPLLSDAYSSSQTYAEGDYCIYENNLYKCTTPVTTAESFDSNKWTATTIGAELLSIKSRLNAIETSLGGLNFVATSSAPVTPSADTVYFVTPS